MLSIFGEPARLCDRVSRREWLRIGSLSVLGIALPSFLRLEAAQTRERPSAARSCILLFMQGGPSQLDTFDPKPGAPAEIRGPFGAIPTSLPGVRVSEYLPRLAAMADQYAIVRTVNYQILTGNHSPCCYHVLTGRKLAVQDALQSARKEDWPSVGAILGKLRPTNGPMPTAVALPHRLEEIAQINTPGQYAAWLGSRYEPFLIDRNENPLRAELEMANLSLPADLPRERLERRTTLKATVDAQLASLEKAAAAADLDTSYQRALSLVASPNVRQAFDLSHEPDALRDRYGRHRFGQSCLLARRMVESGVRFVSVHWPLRKVVNDEQAWDIHLNGFERQKKNLLPPTDQALSALLEDLRQRGLLEETLVLWMGEFGRTPKIGQGITAGNADATGRDHWPFCYSVVLAGGGIRGGQVYGTSDRFAAYPQDRPVEPAQILATVYHALGVDPHIELIDPQGRPGPLVAADPIVELF